jgi:hypothetical protein
MKVDSLFLGENIAKSGKANYHGTKGTLYLTDKRLAFMYEKRGITSTNKYTPVNLPLNTISEVTVIGRGPFKKISIYTYKDRLPTGLPRYEFKVRNPENWTLKIEEACLRITTEETISPIRCAICGTQIEPSQTECLVCGAELT